MKSCLLLASGSIAILASLAAQAADLPQAAKVRPLKMFEVPRYCEGVVFDHEGNGYVSSTEDKRIYQFKLDGSHRVWAETGAPNGHKILADGNHLVCDGSQQAVLLLGPAGKIIRKASDRCDGKPLRKPNDLTLDTAHGGYYFTDPGGSDDKQLIGTLHYVDARGITHLLDDGLAFPNGIVLSADGKRILMGESKKNQILAYDVLGPGRLGPRREFAKLPAKDPAKGQIDNQPDGMCLDAAGNLYVAHYGMQQVQVLSPSGKLLRRYPAGNLTTSNVAFGGPNFDQLFVTGGLGAEAGTGGLFRLDLGVKGLKILPSRSH